MQAMRYSPSKSPAIQCFGTSTVMLCCLAVCLHELVERLQSARISYDIEDCRTLGREKSTATFQGSLQSEQIKRQEHACPRYRHASAATGFSKTVLGTYFIASRRVNTLILVHNREIMHGFLKDIAKFLQIDEELPPERELKRSLEHCRNALCRT